MDARDWLTGIGTGAPDMPATGTARKPLSWTAAVDGHPQEGMVMGGRVTKTGEGRGRGRGMHRRRGGRWRDAYSGSAKEPIFVCLLSPAGVLWSEWSPADKIGGDGCAR
ncbi:hypothetical protein CSHISOI_10103 [Colletotrichum shisoi]|uniref:Uncharacterized protein n=1 Tax=Colletotrichum shisoi TaxID=2078593 RepID=A0A5Q4BEX7_9PEZI|nr:hypothetical protein CSHISOI_10103 [Colletotrichum shisoi]